MLKFLLQNGFGLAVLLVFSCKTSQTNPTPAAPNIELSERLAKIKMSALNGQAFTLQNIAGKPVFLNFWATWCRPCVSEMQSMEEIYQQYKNEVIFLAVSPEAPEKIRAFQQQHQFSFQMAHLDMEFIDAYIISLPTTLLINRKGELVAEEEGLRIWTQHNNLEKIKTIAKRD